MTAGDADAGPRVRQHDSAHGQRIGCKMRTSFDSGVQNNEEE